MGLGSMLGRALDGAIARATGTTAPEKVTKILDSEKGLAWERHVCEVIRTTPSHHNESVLDTLTRMRDLLSEQIKKYPEDHAKYVRGSTALVDIEDTIAVVQATLDGEHAVQAEA